MDAAARSASRIIRNGRLGSENQARREVQSQAKGGVQAASVRRVRTVAGMLMYNSRQRRQPSENFLTRRRGNLPTSKIAWYKRSPSFPRRARSWPIPRWRVTGRDCWKPVSAWKKRNTKWNDFTRVGRNWPRKRNEPRSDGIIAIGKRNYVSV